MIQKYGMFTMTFVVIFLILLVKCKNNINELKIPIINIKVEAIAETMLSESFNDIKYIKLEMQGDNALIGRIDKILIERDTIFIFDRITKSVNIFDIRGRLLYSIKNLGHGPGEYENPLDFIVDFDEKTIEIYDSGKRSILKYNLSNGSYKETLNIGLWFVLFEKIDESTYILQTRKKYNLLDDKELTYDVLIINKKGEVLQKFFPYDPKLKSNNMAMDLLKVFTKTNNEILISKMLLNNIYSYSNTDKNIKPKYYVDYHGNDASEKLKSKETQDLLKIFSDKSNFALMHTIYGETEKYIYFTFGYKSFIEMPGYRPVKPCMAFYDKKTGKTLLYSNIVNDIDGFEIVPPVGVYKNWLVSYVYTEEIHDKALKVSSSEMKYILDKSPKHGNPVIVLFKLNK